MVGDIVVSVGELDGELVVGDTLGEVVGEREGMVVKEVGLREGDAVDAVGVRLGEALGEIVGVRLGEALGEVEGFRVASVGVRVGVVVEFVGDTLGA